MIKSELIRDVRMATSLSHKEAESAVGAVLDAISGALKDGGKVVLSNFGTFTVRERGGYPGRNPNTGESLTVPVKSYVKFKPSHKLLA